MSGQKIQDGGIDRIGTIMVDVMPRALNRDQGQVRAGLPPGCCDGLFPFEGLRAVEQQSRRLQSFQIGQLYRKTQDNLMMGNQ